MELAKSFEPENIERRWYPEWENRGYFDAGLDKSNPNAFCILLPPPNVTGTLHMGHGFNQTIMDALTRYHRMRGFNTLWQPGTDHAGIATQIVVERQLDAQGVSRHELGREKFLEKVWEWKEYSGGTITRQMRRLGTSPDWKRERFTMDEGLSKTVTETFVRLYNEGLIYRGKRLVNWDPKLGTAVSDLEVVSEEEDGKLYHIMYPFSDGAIDGLQGLTVATTRPETLLGDVAVMVHPEDERYAHLIGKTVRLPLTGRDIPIIADDYVDREFGTGCVKVTPAHDFNDYAVGQRHKLDMIVVLKLDGSMPAIAERYSTDGKALEGVAMPASIVGMDRVPARQQVVNELEAIGLMLEIKAHKMQVPRGDRTNVVIEPMLTDQWFVAMSKPGPDGKSITQKALDVVSSGEIKFYPENWINTYNQWLNNIQDWCISRQLWWGHRIPAWYDEEGKIYVATDEEAAIRAWKTALEAEIDALKAEVQARQAKGETTEQHPELAQRLSVLHARFEEGKLRREDDVLDTWYSSALWPFSTLDWTAEWPQQSNAALDLYLPSTVLVTGFDIIFFWVARMVMMTDHFTGQVPFHDVYITGLVRDKNGQKMSKSKGNVLDPIDIIDGISADDLVAKRTFGLMQPKMAEKIEKDTRKEFPNGINPHGADALRFTMAALAGPGRDIKFDLARAEGYKNFCNKLWNATRFALMNVGDATFTGKPQPGTDAERWILSQLDRVSAEAAEHFANYRFDLLAQCLYEFAWNQFCDWFVELAKPALNGDDAATADSTRHTLLYVLDALLRMLHPLVPFVTEELWQAVAPRLGKSGSLMLQPYPQAGDIDTTAFAQADADIEWLKGMASAVRRIRSELGVSPAKQLTLLARGGGADDASRLQRFDASLRFLCKLERIEMIAGEPPAAAPAVVGELQLFVPLEGLVDLDAERARLDKEIAKVAAEKDKSEAKLAKFGAGVPAAVVEQERARLADWTGKLDALSAQRSRLG